MTNEERKHWCKVDVARCTCEPGICHGEAQKKYIDQINALTRYGLTTDEIFEDMAMKENKA